MIVNKIEIEKLIREEAKRGYDLHGGNHSRHEGYAVAKEEFDEFETEYDNVVRKMAELWNEIKTNADSSEILSTLKSVKTRAKLMIGEAIQFAAMIEKMGVFEYEKLNKERKDVY